MPAVAGPATWLWSRGPGGNSSRRRARGSSSRRRASGCQGPRHGCGAEGLEIAVVGDVPAVARARDMVVEQRAWSRGPGAESLEVARARDRVVEQRAWRLLK